VTSDRPIRTGPSLRRKAITEPRTVGRGAVCALLLATAALGACDLSKLKLPAPDAAPPGTASRAQLTLAEIDFDDVPGWSGDDHAAALAPFVKSCTVIGKKSADERLNDNDHFGTYGMWQKI